MTKRLRDLASRDVEVRRGVGGNIRRTREARGRTVKWLADEIGTSDATMTRIEQGKQTCSVDLLDRIAVALDTRVTALARTSLRRAG